MKFLEGKVAIVTGHSGKMDVQVHIVFMSKYHGSNKPL